MIKLILFLFAVPIFSFISCRNEKLDSENHRLNALLYFSQGNILKARESIEMPVKCGSLDKDFFNVAAQIYFANGERDMALKLYDDSKNFGNAFTATDLRIYMMLLNDHERFDDCLLQLRNYFNEAPYFYGLGQFASQVYEKNGLFFESVLSAWLDLEYLRAFKNDVSIENFTNQISRMCRESRDFIKIRQLRAALDVVESSAKNYWIASGEYESDFFICKYIKSKCQLLSKENPVLAMETYIGLEKYFSGFPQYYFFLAEYSAVNKILDKKDLELLYETVIKMKPESEYTNKAKIALAELWGVGGSL